MKPQPELNHDHVILTIESKLSQLPHTHQEPFIFKVFERYRKQNKRAYKPELLAIGPYSHRKAVLIHTIEEQKLRYLQLLLARRGDKFGVKRYVDAIRHVKERVRRCYATDFPLTTDDQLVELLVVDGIFIVELARKFSNRNLVDRHDMIFKMNWIHHVLWRDMLLFENQIPFFVVEMLFQMTRCHEETGDKGIVDLLFSYYCRVRKYYHYHTKSLGNYLWLLNATQGLEGKYVKHILHLIRHVTTRSFAEDLLKKSKNDQALVKWKFIDNLTELHETGIKFKVKHDTSLFDVTYSNGVLEIPLLTIEEKTEGLLRNFIAYEQCQDEEEPRIVSDYSTLLYCLIKSSKDVGLLRKYGILNNLIGDDESASGVISSLSRSVFVSHDRFCYKDVFNGVNEYYGQRRHLWVANLRKHYFNTPWAVISFIAAVVLLLLTFTQTIASVIPLFT